MERKGRIRSKVLTRLAIAAAMLASCALHENRGTEEVGFRFFCGSPHSRSVMPDEDRISDISIMIFDDRGAAEECLWLEDGITECSAMLVKGNRYTICACANFGRQVYADDIGELDEIRCHLAYPDDYREGIPMFAREEITIGEDTEDFTIELERLMAKVTLRMDRRKLSDDVEIFVRSVQIGNCPRTSGITEPNKVLDEDECFPSGFFLDDTASADLNKTSESGLSKSVSLYMLENMQGKLDSTIDRDEDKTFDRNDHKNTVCSYIEINMDYTSENYTSGSDGLIYRFYLGEDRNDLNIERNCHYRITVTPENDGLSDDGWRIDKSDMKYTGPTYIKGHPSDYIVGDIGDKIHIWCDLLPENALFDVGREYMEDDKAEGIYDYEIDEDGHGATLTLTGPGRGLIYMEAGDPINDAALFIIEVNKP